MLSSCDCVTDADCDVSICCNALHFIVVDKLVFILGVIATLVVTVQDSDLLPFSYAN